MGKLFKIVILITGCILIALPPGSMAIGGSSGDISWQRLETKHTVIHYQTLEDLKEFNRNIRYYPGQSSLKRLFSRSGTQDLKKEITKKVDAVYQRVQEILGMYKKSQKVTIDIFTNAKKLHAAYLKVYRTKRQNYQPAATVTAWYTYKTNTIYLNRNNLHEGMLAHEMAHAVIENYHLIRPPEASHEILAQYVDSHLFY